MARLLLRKILRVITVLIGVVLITFLLMHAIPGNPWSNYSTNQRAMMNLGLGDPALPNELARRFGLDQPLWRQFTRYLIGDFDEEGSFFCGAVCGNLGPSIAQRGRTVTQVLFDPPEGKTFWESRFGYSMRLILLAAGFAVGLGMPLGLLMATARQSVWRRAISVDLAAMISIPNFVLGLLAIIVLASWLGITKVLPNWNNPAEWVVPGLVLATMPMASIARITHAGLMNTLSEDYVRTARAKGLGEMRVNLVHILRNALVPIITFLGPTLLEMATASFIVENLYAFPGFGREYWYSVLQLDYPMILALTLLYAVGMGLVNLLVEVLGDIVDPRLRSLKQAGAP